MRELDLRCKFPSFCYGTGRVPGPPSPRDAVTEGVAPRLPAARPPPPLHDTKILNVCTYGSSVLRRPFPKKLVSRAPLRGAIALGALRQARANIV